MKTIVQKTLIMASLYIVSITSGHAFDLDATVDDEIRKNYNPNQLINDTKIKESALDKNIQAVKVNNVIDENLPALPSITKYPESKKTSDVKNDTIVQPIKPYLGGNVRVKSGTTINVLNNTSISDWQRKGTKIRFTTKGNTFGKDYTIPAGTVFNAEIIESHQPQITCNGGLIVIKVDSMIYKGQKIPVTGYITRANDKKIFFNNIKGERTFLKTIWKKGNWGRALFSNLLNTSIKLGAEGATLVLAPFPVAYGTLCLGVNAITSPICAFFSKGGHISIPANSNFRIKLIEDVMID